MMMVDRPIDADALRARWDALWPGVPFLDWHFVTDDRALRLHSLPKSKQYADTAHEWAQILLRQTTLLGEVVAASPDPSRRLLLVTRSVSAPEPDVKARDEWFDALVPGEYLTTEVEDSDDPDLRAWNHYFAERVSLGDPGLVAALALRADDSDVMFIVPEDLAWAFRPYPGGVDIIAPSLAARNELEAAHREWLPHPERLRFSDYAGEPAWGLEFARLTETDARRIAALIREQDWARDVTPWISDPARSFDMGLSRPEAQLVRIVLTGVADDVLLGEHWHTGSDDEFRFLTPGRRRIEPDEALRILSSRLPDMDDFLDDYGYRAPQEAVDGRLDEKHWDPSRDYTGIDGTPRPDEPPVP